MALVLIVDDVRTLADQYAYDLKRIGKHETRVVSSGQAALDTMANEAVDCVIEPARDMPRSAYPASREGARGHVTQEER